MLRVIKAGLRIKKVPRAGMLYAFSPENRGDNSRKTDSMKPYLDTGQSLTKSV
ncbi:hypothetical protein J19TS2_59460 [Cohnella xylanilytica]|nr:hypothetical protein J19TS2_59460 [Cohnella xylanilytica]